MRAEAFADIEARAIERKGGAGRLSQITSEPLSQPHIAALDDSVFLVELTKKVFQSGFVWRVVEQKWPAFEEVFFSFDIEKILLMPDDMLEKKARDPAIIRNLNKVHTIRENALMIKRVADEHGSFARFVSQWPNTDIIGLWSYLQKNGARLGGNTGPYALRYIGVDTFLLSQDVEHYFRHYELISGGLRSKQRLKAFQDIFNAWHSETGYSMTRLSQTLSYSVGDNFVGF
ncbi:MAG: DNA-3-methyladenine glycosylase I [Pseudomonadota bacterium]